MDLPLTRRARRADVGAVWPLARDFATSFRPERTAFEATFELLVDEPRALVLVAETHGKVCGYLLAHTHATFLANRPITWVEEVMVAEEQRRSGIGRALMDAAEEWAAREGSAYISLATRRASGFYEQLGYDDSATFYKKHLRS